MLARGALCRLAADVPKTSSRLPQLGPLLRRALLARHAATSPAARAYASALYARRAYATATARATKPTATVKKAVKAAAAKKKPAAAPKKKATTAKKAASTKKPVRKRAAKKPAAKKAAPKKSTPEEKEKAKIRELRIKALKEPVTEHAVSAFNVFIADNLIGKTGGSRADNKSRIAETARKFKDLTPAEHEHYNHLAQERTAAKKAEYQAWIQTHTVDQIRIANNARSLLRRKLGTAKGSRLAHTNKLHDERQVKQPPSGYQLFFTSRHGTGDFKGIKPTEACKLIGNEWKSLAAGEKKKFQDDAKAAKRSA
ncbi:hypothetical protein BDW02DRAFT_491779 [Decorospora gaudefroyi]|uniref:HMG box domain-containing protein n=1 Tax=Decorospora gaudefroyi TaxID=184978 RepID=A0A6A5KMR3_9PLEO|nr:hypothetical protein BDW02DRAFT_491779 [Decorospora gaudefroyi]